MAARRAARAIVAFAARATATLLSAATVAAGANAQLAASLAATTDVRLRGLSLNGGAPALTASLSYDHPGGGYAGVALTAGDTRRFGVQYLGHIAWLGYATRLSRRLSAEAGIIDTQVNSNAFRRFSGRYTEVYAGISSERLSARVFYTPSFFARGLDTAYLDLNGNLQARPDVRLFGHVGVLIPIAGSGGNIVPRTRADLRFGAAALLGRAEFQLAWVHSGAGADYLGPRRQSPDALVLGATWSF